MKILLIYPYFLEERSRAEEDIRAIPIGLYYVAAVLKENHYPVEILNWHDINKTPQKVEEVLKEKRPGVIGFSILHANRWGGIEIARIAKKIDPRVKIVFGGIGATLLWKHLLSHFSEIDFVVLGEGEYAFLDLLKWLENDFDVPIENIKGIAFRKKGKIIRTTRADRIDKIDELPIPAKYFKYRHLSMTRGCAQECAFCGSPKFWGRRVRFRSPENFVEELELLYDKGIRFFYFSDDNFTIEKSRVVQICKKIVEKNMKIGWYAISRVDQVSDELLYWMRKAGCIQISYGVESGSEKIRRLLKKNIETEQIKKAFALTTKYGILPRAYFIYGSPEETWETIQETIDLVQEIKPLSIVFYILDLFPGTELYSAFEKKLHITDDIWLNKIEGIMYFETTPALSDELILAFGKKLRTAFYKNLHRYIDSIQLADKKELYEIHADFCSRLAMTFSHGDYSKIGLIRERGQIAEKLYRKSLSYYPDQRAYLGLGILKQKAREFKESIQILSEGANLFPDSEELSLCLGISYMNLKEYNMAIPHFLKFPDSREANFHLERCYEALGE
jgi:radical SAM superfamily enzyme YgiQ (UPF0313 family)